MINKTPSLIKKKILCLMALSGFLTTAQAGGGPSYSIDNYVISSGGTISSGGNFTIQGSIGQVVTGSSSSAPFNMQSGYWHENTDLIFKNSFE